MARPNQARRMAILLVEQNARLTLTIADRGYVLESGEISVPAAPPGAAHNPLIQRAYLGT